MNVVVTGATSFIGAHTAVSFSQGNNVFLIARDSNKLSDVADGCRAAGAKSATQIIQDLRLGIQDILRNVDTETMDLVITTASSTSRQRDDEISGEDVQDHAAVDLIAPLELIQHILSSRPTGHRLDIILVSSVLTLVRSPNRLIYSSFKTLQEEYLRRIVASYPNVTLLIVRVAKVIPADHDSQDAAKLAQTILTAYLAKKKDIFYGMSGIMLTGLFYTQPMLFRLIMMLQRAVRGRVRDAST